MTIEEIQARAAEIPDEDKLAVAELMLLASQILERSVTLQPNQEAIRQMIVTVSEMIQEHCHKREKALVERVLKINKEVEAAESVVRDVGVVGFASVCGLVVIAAVVRAWSYFFGG